MAQFLYYLILKPLSLLPLGVLHKLSDFLAFLMYRVVPYRQKVIRENLRNSFPEKTDEEIEVLVKRYIAHLCDLIVESISLFSMSQKELQKRVRVINPEEMNQFYDQGKNVILTFGHYNNWEMSAAAFNAQLKHQIVGLYTPLKNKFFEKKFKESRGKSGSKAIPKMEVKAFMRTYIKKKRPFALTFGTDQSPTYSKKVYWTKFLSQDTAVMFGTEKYARELNAPVIFGEIRKVKRGYYDIFFEVLVEDPSMEPHCAITEKHTRRLEKQIIEEPAYWLWSHKRWKRKVTRDYPDGVIPEPELQV
ncbi:lysophospholipid acyltransferase family protein [Sediminitomix flava]|uniref:KDO2-lipid IV(A) lauroyltransferase n=1 Tax=Sediminitomix flava TaxID=379075 RepID=A0A315ZFG8_SEDFL|nr:hypothetical protein [Sediminitomix flava]PWJ44336.1 KDO2-lipid IV(A) lauroyltransferase [Sediminitomix flava]